MKKSIKILSIILSVSILSGCASQTNPGGVSNQSGGAVIGALAGGLLGSTVGRGGGQLLAIGAGALVGGFVGSSVGKSMDDRDKMMAERTSQNALEMSPSGTSTTWKNPDTGHSGYVTPTKTYKTREGRYCREFTHAVVIGGKEEKAYGKACRQQDGQWQIISE